MSAAGMVIIGAGHAAIRATIAMREAGFGGAITMIAEEGLNAPYERPPLSKWSADDGVAVKPIVASNTLVAADLTRIVATVNRIWPNDKIVELSGGRTLSYTRLLIATGARARRMPVETFGDTPVHYLRSLEDSHALHRAAQTARNAVIIGGGFIGLELAASLRSMGVGVHVIEVADRLLARAVTAPVARIVHDLHRAQGVSFSFNARLAQRQTPGHVTVGDGTVFPADLIIAGIGSIPNSGLAEEAGLAVENGITVDAALRTSNAAIFAAGDCCSFPLYGDANTPVRLESWQSAGDQGAVAGRSMIGAEEAHYTQVPWFWSHQYDHVLQVSGLLDPANNIERPYAADHHVSFGMTRAGTLGFACGIGPGTKVAKDIRFAAKIIGTGIQVAPTALADPQLALKSLLRG